MDPYITDTYLTIFWLKPQNINFPYIFPTLDTKRIQKKKVNWCFELDFCKQKFLLHKRTNKFMLILKIDCFKLSLSLVALLLLQLLLSLKWEFLSELKCVRALILSEII